MERFGDVSAKQFVDAYHQQCAAQEHDVVQAVVDIVKAHGERVFLDSKVCLDLRGSQPAFVERRLADMDAQVISKAWRKAPTSYCLNLSYNNIGDPGIVHLANMLKDDCSLQELNVAFNDFTEVGAEALSQALQLNRTLKHLNVAGNKIGNMGGLFFANSLQINTSLERLDLEDTDQKAQSLIAFCTVLKCNNVVHSLNISRPLLTSTSEETTVHVGRMLKVNLGLQELHLAKHDIRDFGAERLYENLQHNRTLRLLSLSCNRIGRDGAAWLSKLLRCNTALATLNLTANRIEDDGAEAIAEALSIYNTNLQRLYVGSNTLTGRGLCALANCLHHNSTLTHIYVWGNKFDHDACKAFAVLLGTSPRIQPDNTDVRPYIVDGITYVAHVT